MNFLPFQVRDLKILVLSFLHEQEIHYVNYEWFKIEGSYDVPYLQSRSFGNEILKLSYAKDSHHDHGLTGEVGLVSPTGLACLSGIDSGLSQIATSAHGFAVVNGFQDLFNSLPQPYPLRSVLLLAALNGQLKMFKRLCGEHLVSIICLAIPVLCSAAAQGGHLKYNTSKSIYVQETVVKNGFLHILIYLSKHVSLDYWMIFYIAQKYDQRAILSWVTPEIRLRQQNKLLIEKLKSLANPLPTEN